MIVNTDIRNLLRLPPILSTKDQTEVLDLLRVAYGMRFERVWELQLRLLDSVIGVEDQITSLRSDSKALLSLIPGLRASGDLMAVRSSQSKATALNRQAEERKYYRHCLLMVGDHIAARLLDPDTIRRFSNFPSAGFIHGKEGLKAEIRAAEHFVAEGYLVLFNDLTHSLRIGDLTLRREDEVRTFEVKSNPNEYGSKEAARQILTPLSIHDYVKTDVMDKPHRISGDPHVIQGAVRLDSNVKEDWHWDIAGQIHKAIRRGGFTCIQRGHKYYLAARRREVEELSNALETLTSEGDWVVSNIQRRVEDNAEVAPFTQWFKSESAVEIMTGELVVLSAWKLSDLESLFAAKGHILTWQRKMTDLFPICVEGGRDATLKFNRTSVGEHHRLKVMYAFLALESYVDIVAFLLSPEATAQMKEKIARSRRGATVPAPLPRDTTDEPGTIH